MTHKWAHPDLHFVFPVIRPKSASSTTRVVSDLWIKEWREMLKKTTHFDLELWEKEMGIENQQPQIFADAFARGLARGSGVAARAYEHGMCQQAP